MSDFHAIFPLPFNMKMAGNVKQKKQSFLGLIEAKLNFGRI